MNKKWIALAAAACFTASAHFAFSDDADMEVLPIKYPKPAYKETPKNPPAGLKIEARHEGPPAQVKAPAGCTNIALKKPVTSSETDPVIGTLDLVTDGNKEADEGAYVELGRGPQWVQIDLGDDHAIYDIAVWHFHGQARVYHDVVVQVSDDKDFKTGVTTLFNNDEANELKLGAGKDPLYWDSFEGRVIDAKGTKARYVRLWSDGNTSDEQSHYTEVEVWGK